MKRFSLILSVLAATIGAGIAFSPRTNSKSGDLKYNWYTIGGTFVAMCTINNARIFCIPGTLETCLFGTISNRRRVTLLGSLQM
jgi:hypothetical protein